MAVQICSRCIYDARVPDITFDGAGVCSYCHTMDRMDEEYPTGEAGARRLEQIVDRIKRDGRGRKYDCVIGVSGGCDSSFLLHRMKEMGLRPLAAHFDNTWNSTIATENIHLVLRKLNIDLFTHVVDNEEADAICRSFLLSGVPDIEAFTDVAGAATMYLAAAKHGIRYIIEGHSFRTEGISPLGWLYFDGKYVESVTKQYSGRKLETYPNLWMTSFLKWILVDRIRKIRPLYYMDYRKEEAKKMLAEEYGWQWYGGHHLENRYTAFYHSYFMPKRWGIDQRANGYAALVRSGQMERDEALALMAQPPHLEDEVVELLRKRLGFSDAEFEHVMTLPKRSYREFRTYKHTFERMRPFFWLMYRRDLVPKSFYMKYTHPHPETPPVVAAEREAAPARVLPAAG
jgi:N-acetyl sugar amidotransferase